MYTVEIRPADGGDDATRFAGELTDMVLAAARRGDLAAEVTASGRTTTISVDSAPG
jgi:protein subunit release factor A